MDTLDQSQFNKFRHLALVDIVKAQEVLPVEGKPGTLKHIAFSDLIIDESYQRGLGRKEIANITTIYHQFSWLKFIPGVVCSVKVPGYEEGRYYFMIDGQCRSTAAYMRYKLMGDIGPTVPCIVMDCTIKQAAAAFAAINGQTTSISKLQLFISRLAADEKEASGLNSVLSECGVTIVSGYATGKVLKVGETMALATIESCLAKFGKKTIQTTLTAIVEGPDGNPGCLQAPLIKALCQIIYANPALLDHSIIVNDVIARLDLPDFIRKAKLQAAAESETASNMMLGMLRAHFASNTGDVIAKLQKDGVI